MLLCEIKFHLSCAPTVWCDNVNVLALASNPVYHARTKCIEIDHYFMREKVLSHDIILKLISTHDQIADIFTKGLSSTRFLQLRSKLMMDSTPINLRGANREPSPAKPSLPTTQSKSSPTQSIDCGIRQAPAVTTQGKALVIYVLSPQKD
jgi:hypothetical protein